MLTHLEVAMVRFYEAGKEIVWRINGNTRDELWENHQGTLIDPSLVPSQLVVTIYDVANRRDAEKLYYTIDSSESAESGSEKITGIFSKLSLTFSTDKIKKGILTKILEFASHGTTPNPKGMPITNDNREPIVKYFREELQDLDGCAIGTKNPRFKQLAMWALALMALKKYSNNEKQTEKVIQGIKRIKRNQSNTSNPSWDGITHILSEWNSGKDNGELMGVQGGSCAVTLPRQLDFLLFHFKNYMDDVEETEGAWSRKTQRKRSLKKGNYFFNNWYTL
tara:strand:- start:102 stop:938 length:837 start_codon:yes stop_codon:yes gene_type:complete